jgi:hypothetical protein
MMNVKRILGLTLVLCALAAFAVPISGLAADDAKDLSVYFRPAVRFGTDDRVLYIMDFLVPVYRGDTNIVFLNTKLTPDNQDNWETNLGIGYRHLMFSDKLVLGANVFYDLRRTDSGNYWHQVGLGAEAMTEINKYLALTGRFNYYIPLTDAKVRGSGGTGTGFVFRTGGIWTAAGGSIEEAPEGFDGELGVRIPVVSDYVETWAYGGGYHYHGDHVGTIDGWTARLELIPTDFLRLNYEYRDDNTGSGEHFGEVALEVPFSIDNLIAGKNPFAGMGDMLKGSRTLKERMVEPVHRDVDIRVVSAGSGGGTGTLVEGVIFVSDGAASGGDGSYENPYNTLAAALADSRIVDGSVTTIHVLADTAGGVAGTTLGSAGLTIWGAGTENPDYPGISNFVSGNSTITSTLTMNAINQTIMGLYFNTSSDYAIEIGSGAGGAGLTITGNTINSTGSRGIHAQFNGIIGASASPVVISDNVITLNSSVSYPLGIYLYSTSSTGNIYASILNNHVNIDNTMDYSVASGIYLRAGNGGSLVTTISGNEIESDNSGTWCQSYGAYLYGGNSTSASISGNTISSVESASLSAGIDFEGPGPVTGSVTGNHIIGISSSEESYGIRMYPISGATTISITNNEIGIASTSTSYSAAALYARTSGSGSGTLGTSASPLYFTGNYGSIDAPHALMMYLNADDPGSSDVRIGTGSGNMGSNSFTTTGYWYGNYPSSDPYAIYISSGSFVNP